MRKFEYEIRTLSNTGIGEGVDREKRLKWLNEKGEEAWELVSVVNMGFGNTSAYHFKREIGGNLKVGDMVEFYIDLDSVSGRISKIDNGIADVEDATEYGIITGIPIYDLVKK